MHSRKVPVAFNTVPTHIPDAFNKKQDLINKTNIQV